ncbi:UNVERIFIED_CONTAM: hypothetical protein PYX00_010050 [Menopon gallinae]|uniref:Dihydrolipoamide acetyltransferase component of pyruvate dehydrogenase complex n=1 Tax=Menopon gallinae TaxID=328185 RepID=A0AAW2HE32_9NEOP
MALRICSQHFRIQKLEKLFYKVNKNIHPRYLSNYESVKSCQIVLNGSLPRSSTLNGISHSQSDIRSFHVARALQGTIVPYKLSDIGEGIVEVVIKEWFIKPGDKISEFDQICEVQSDKASVTITSRYEGIVKKLYHEVDGTAKVGEPLIDIEIEDDSAVGEEAGKESPKSSEPAPAEKAPAAAVASEPAKEDQHGELTKALATPAVRRMAMENNIDLKKVKGTGKGGRVLKEDVILYVESLKGGKPATSAGVPEPPPPGPPKITVEGQDIVQEIKGIRKAMVKTMASAWTIPHFSYCDEVDVTELVNMKDELKRIGNSKGVKLTFMPFFIKAASMALNKYPILNSAPDEKCEKITIKASHNISVAIDSPHGLVVPNIKNVQKLDIIEIAAELNRLQVAAANGKLGLDDLNGGTFSLSNIGIIGGTYMKPILVAPQVIIGAIGKIQVLPRFDKNKNIIEAHIFNISWSADHRVLDGATVARFSNLWKLLVETPKVLLNL